MAAPTNPTGELTRAARRVFMARSADFGLDTDRVEVRYVLNEGGFVNTSLQVSDGRTALHVKLATTGEGQAALRQWFELVELLRRHRAPPVLDWVEVGAAAGLVFPRLEGRAPSPNADVIGCVLSQVRGLWTDAELAQRLEPGSVVTAADCYLAGYHDRFRADLEAIRIERPPFVGEGDLAYLHDEVGDLERRVAESSAFLEEMTAPTHGDLWLNNVLWQGPDAWWLLDWDDLRIGDPAVDVTMLNGPTATDLRPLKDLDQGRRVLTGAAHERLDLLGRASLLDWVIDPLADWIEARAALAHQASVRAEKERVHREAIALYRELYGR